MGPRWREATERAQCAELPSSGRVVVSCTARLGVGGLGRHLYEIHAALERAERQVVCICGSTRAPAAPTVSPAPTVSAVSAVSAAPAARRSPGRRSGVADPARLLRKLPIPASPGARARAFFVEFDAYAAQHLPRAEHLIAFNSQALTQFRAARAAGYESLSLVSANPHLRLLRRQHALARRHYPLEGSWATRLLERNLDEYAQADRIYCASRYIRESFLQEGFSEGRLASFPLTPDPRYQPEPRPGLAGPDLDRDNGIGACRWREVRREAAERFEIVYVGSLTVHKGVPLLIDSVRRLPHTEIGLRLIGGWATRGMRRFVQRACASDPRISVSPGDPLPHLRRASLYVHPAYEDGFGYAPAEALACGVPLIVSEDTGMKDLIDSPRTGLILPTGDLDALTEAIEAAYRGELFTPAGPDPSC